MAVTRILDGPARGALLNTRRAPMYLRVVIDRQTREVDALDQLDDTARAMEDLYVYAAVPETWSFVFVRPGGRFEGADYRFRNDLSPGERISLRDNELWRIWAGAQPPIKLMSPKLEEALEKARVAQERISKRIAPAAGD